MLKAFGYKLKFVNESEKSPDYGTVVDNIVEDPVKMSLDCSTLLSTHFFRIVLVKRIATIALLGLFFGLSLSLRYKFS